MYKVPYLCALMPNKYLLIILMISAQLALAQTDPKERALPLTSQFLSAEMLQLNWPAADAPSTVFSIFKRLPLSENSPQLVSQQSDTTFTDNLPIGELAEYFVYQSDPFPFKDTIAIDAGAYKVQVYDEFGKGLCCNFGNGYFNLKKEDGASIFFASDFGQDEFVLFDIDSNQNLYLEIQSDLFGDHLMYSIEDLSDGEIITDFGPFGTYLERPPSYGVLWVANEYHLPTNKGTVFIAVAEYLFDDLAQELEALKSDLAQLGYQVVMQSIDPNLSDAAVKNIIDPVLSAASAPHTLFLLGNIPVPYAGDIFPDTHSENHKGAWSADGFYGVPNSFWTDETVNETSAFFDRNKNIPGDGKWDQSTFPSTVNYRIGRVDMSRLTAFAQDEIALTKAYLNKSSKWRNGEMATNYTAIIDDNFMHQFGAPAANGYRNLWNMLGQSAVEEKDFNETLNASAHLWAYSCGSGTHMSSEGVSSTAEIAEDSLQAIFLMSFGSQFGDWDNENNYLRAPLASGTVLTNTWVGNPHQDFREMSVGFPIGMGMQRNMNTPAPLHEKGPVMVHLGLLGDPTITQYPIAAAKDLLATQIAEEVSLSWTEPSLVAGTAAYKIFRRASIAEDYQLLTPSAITGNTFIDTAPLIGNNDYAVVTEARIVNNSGSFYKQSAPTNLSMEFSFLDAVETLTDEQLWKVYPNPTRDKMCIIHEALSRDKSTAQLLNIFGQAVPIEFEEKANSVTLDLSQLAPGVYYYKKGELLSPPLVLFR